MTTQQKNTMYAEIEKHGNNLNAIFNTPFDAITLCKKLRQLEKKASKIAEDYCNGDNNVTTENIDTFTDPILKAVKKLLNTTDNYPIVFNGDCRGYALKIPSDYVRYTNMKIYIDWGGNGIIAPDFTPNN